MTGIADGKQRVQQSFMRVKSVAVTVDVNLSPLMDQLKIMRSETQ